MRGPGRQRGRVLGSAGAQVGGVGLRLRTSEQRAGPAPAVMARAAPPALLLPLLGLAAATAAAAAAAVGCPSSTWVQFQDSCYIFLQEAIKVESIEDVRNQCTDHGADMVSIHNEEENTFILETLKKQWKGPDDILLGMFFDTDDASFKWFDKSNMTFDKWSDQEDGEDLVDTCAFLHTKTGEWKKGNCEVSSVEGTLCKAAIPYEKKYLSDNHILISALVIASTVILTVLGAVIWFLYKRNLDSGFTTVFSTAPQSPFNDDCVLVVAEENEYAVQFD